MSGHNKSSYALRKASTVKDSDQEKKCGDSKLGWNRNSERTRGKLQDELKGKWYLHTYRENIEAMNERGEAIKYKQIIRN